MKNLTATHLHDCEGALPRATHTNRIAISTIVAALVLGVADRAAEAGVVFWDGGGNGSSWHDPLNWSTDMLPVFGDDVQISVDGKQTIVHSTGNDMINSLTCEEELVMSGGALTMMSASSFAELTFNGGTIEGQGNFTLNGVLTWNAGTMDGDGTTFANGGINMRGGGTKTVNRSLEHMGIAVWGGSGTFRINGNGEFTNLPGALFDVVDDAVMTWIGSPGVFRNQGTFRKSAGPGLTQVVTAFDNSDTVEVQTGTLRFSGGGDHTGDFLGSTMLEFGGGTHTLEITASVTVPNVIFSAGQTDVFGTYDVIGETSVSGGTHTFHSVAVVSSVGDSLTISGGIIDLRSGDPITVSEYGQVGGTLDGTSDITVTNLLTWTAGVIEGDGTTLANNSTVLSSGGTKTLNRTLENAGTTTWTGSGQFRINGAGEFTNLPGALFEAVNDAVLTWTGSSGVFNNEGMFRKVFGPGLTHVVVTFNNSGTVEAQTGTIEFSNGGVHIGVFTGPATIEFGGGTHTLGVASVTASHVIFSGGQTDVFGSYDLMGSGTAVSGGTHTFHPGSFVGSIGDSLTISGGIIDFNSDDPITVVEYSQSGGTLDGNSDITVTDLLTWSAGVMQGEGTTFASGETALSGGGTKTLDRTLENAGTTIWTGSGQFRINGAGQFTNLPGALVEVLNDAVMTWSGASGVFDNQGTFRKAFGTGTTQIVCFFTNSGAVEVQIARLLKSGSNYVQTGGTTSVAQGSELEVSGGGIFDLQGGSLTGSGRVDADVVSAGAVEPGDSPGELTIEGTYTQTDVFAGPGTLAIELGGTNPVTEYDVLTIIGDAELAGTLSVIPVDGFGPEIGQSFTILTATGSVMGEFEEVDCSMYRVNYDLNSVVITVVAGQIVGDINCDSTVGIADFLILLADWGPCPDPCPPFCPADLDGDCNVGITDFLLLLANWTS